MEDYYLDEIAEIVDKIIELKYPKSEKQKEKDEPPKEVSVMDFLSGNF